MKNRFCFDTVLKVLTTLPLLAAMPLRADTHITVSTDGSAQFNTVQAAIMSVPAGAQSNHLFIHIKPGAYKELIYIQHEKRYFHPDRRGPEDNHPDFGPERESHRA